MGSGACANNTPILSTSPCHRTKNIWLRCVWQRNTVSLHPALPPHQQKTVGSGTCAGETPFQLTPPFHREQHYGTYTLLPVTCGSSDLADVACDLRKLRPRRCCLCPAEAPTLQVLPVPCGSSNLAGVACDLRTLRPCRCCL